MITNRKKHLMYGVRNFVVSGLLAVPGGSLKADGIQAANFSKGRELYKTRGCPTCHGLEEQWKKKDYKVTFPNTKALVGFSQAVNAAASDKMDEKGYIEHFVQAVLKQDRSLTPEEDKVYKAEKRNPQGVNLMFSMINAHFVKLSDQQKKEDLEAIGSYIRAYRKSPESFK